MGMHQGNHNPDDVTPHMYLMSLPKEQKMIIRCRLQWEDMKKLEQ